MKISIIVAMDEVGTVGQNGELPWRQSADLREFERLTYGHHVVMGRLTWTTLPADGLPGRNLIVLASRFHKQIEAAGAIVQSSLTAAIDYARDRGETELFIAGGAEVYALAMAYADRLYITRIHTVIKGKHRVKFPDLGWRGWAEIESRGPSPADEHNDYSYTFQRYDWQCDQPLSTMGPQEEGTADNSMRSLQENGCRQIHASRNAEATTLLLA